MSIAGADVVDDRLPVPQVFRQFDDHGRLLDHHLRDQLQNLIADLVTRVDVRAAVA